MDKSEDFRAVAKAMAGIDFCMMQTLADGMIRTRPMSNNGDVAYDGDNWFFTCSGSAKVAEISKDNRVQLTFADNVSASFISVWGTAQLIDDVDMKRRLWQEELRRWFEGGPEDPAVVLIKVSAQRIQTWGRLGDLLLE